MSKTKIPLVANLPIEPYSGDLTAVAEYLDNLSFSRVKTKYSKGDDWTAVAIRGYGPEPTDILKPNVLKSKVDEQVELQDTWLRNEEVMKPINEILDRIPAEFERVRFMKLEAGKVIGKHTDKIDKELGFEDGEIVRLHVPIRTNENVVFTLFEGKTPHDNYMEQGKYYYANVVKPHAVANNSDVDRIHLVIDCYSNQTLRDMILGEDE